MTALLEIHDLIVSVENTVILDLPELTVNRNEVLVVVGPNGAGKSTLLQVSAGLLKPTRGKVFFTSDPQLTGLDYRRKVSTVFQSPLLLSGTVRNNIASGLKFRQVDSEQIRQRVDTWMEQLHISHLARRQTAHLSGGEAQRVSLARAFCLETELILMDEPFSALDTPTRTELLRELRELLSRTGQTCIYVTHDLQEALAVGDRIGILFDGKLHQLDVAANVFKRPKTPEVAAFVGVENIIPGKIMGLSNELVQIQANGFSLEAVGGGVIGQEVYACLRPEDVTLYLTGTEVSKSTARNHLPCRIRYMFNQGPLVRIELEADFPLTALVTRPSAEEMNLAVGKEVLAVFKSTAVHLIETGHFQSF
jgi:tungstate transport system ATP-binding protein